MHTIVLPQTAHKAETHKNKISFPLLPTLKISTGSRSQNFSQKYKVHLCTTHNGIKYEEIYIEGKIQYLSNILSH
jgi:hypothetical protein